MPEGHVIHRLADALTDSFAGEPVTVTSPQGRFAAEAARLDGSVLVGSEAVGKHLFAAFDVPEPALIHIHLGLIGRLNIGSGDPSAGQSGCASQTARPRPICTGLSGAAR